MAAYAAVVSLQHTINGLMSSSARISSSGEIFLEAAYMEASSLLQALEGLNGSNRSRSSMERVDALEAQIRDSAHKLEDVLEFHELKQLEEEDDGDEEGVMRQEIRYFRGAAKRLVKEYLAELRRDDDDDDDEDITYTDFGVEMIGRSRLFKTILKQNVVKRMRPDDRYVCVFSGEKGSGSRILTKAIFEDARMAGKLECWGWAKVGRGYELRRVLMRLIAQVGARVNDGSLVDATDDGLSEYLYKALENRRYMIVLDDVEDVELVKYLTTTSFPDQSNGSVVLVTSVSPEVGRYSDLRYNLSTPDTYKKDFLLQIRHALFGSEPIPIELEVAGKEIVQNTRLVLLSLAKTLVFLSKSDKTVEQWRKLAADKDNPSFTVADDLSEDSKIQKEMQHCEWVVAQSARKFIDFSNVAKNVNKLIYPERFFSKMQVISFFGMAGIGKTTFVRNLFTNDSTWSHFDHHVWIHIGSRYKTEEILMDILAQIYPHIPKLDIKGDKKLMVNLCVKISHKRCIVVLDDLCSQGPLHHLREIFPKIKGAILVTTRLPKVTKFGRDDTTIEMQLLSEEESWCLLRRKVFDEGLCPPKLESGS